ncbi:Calx-beta domain-containing protein, partial [Nevskia sp.]|uniref:Calx-beta domain-containing protein n=1 Tax=Nevskia sp. TaxID=1929292 RepID=UPI0026012FF3
MTQQKNQAGPTPRLLRTTLLAAGLSLSGAAVAQQAPATMQASAQSQIAVLQQIKNAKTLIEDKLDSALFMATLKQRGDARLAQLPEYQYLKAGKDGRYSVDIGITDREDAAVVLRKLSEIGAVLVSPKSTAVEYKTIRAKLRLSDLMTLAGLKQVTRVQEAVEALTNVVNVSEGDKAHAADQARGSFGATGAGVKVCALSDGVNSLAASQASGDLPAVDVLPGQAGSGDEGTAMLEIIHDLAPSATLGFATAFNSEASFAQNIRDLATDGCNIIVDDVLYFDENVFQDGVVAKAVNDVTASGVLYFSSAGNSGNKTDNTSGTWEGDFLASTLANPTPLAGVGPLHDFGDGGQSVQVTGASTSGALIIWAENYDLTGGTASTDYDLYLLNSTMTSVVQSSTNRQNGVGGDDRAYERVSPISVGQRLVVNRFAVGNTSSPPMFHLSTLRGTITSALSTSGVTRGHSATADGYGVAATPAGPIRFDNVPPVGPFPNAFTASNATESFSSDGPRRIILGPTGAELTPGNRTATGGVVRQQPVITAADGVSTSAPGFNPFFGTSAAAPHAAAIAALLKSGVPSLTPVQVRNFLTSTAIDIEVPGVDRTTGYGIVMPLPALQAAGATPQPFLSAGTAVYTQIVGDGDNVIEPNETWSISLPLTNIGAASAASINSTLSSATAGVTILSANSTYPNLAPSASAGNATAYQFRVETAFPCGSPINFSQNLSYIGANSPQTVAFASGTGGLGNSATFTYAGSPVAIPDNGAAINVPLSVSGISGAIGDVNLKIDGASCSATAGSTTVGIDHTYVADLAISLVSPDGTVVPVISNAGGAGNNLCQTALDDESAGPGIQTVAAAQAPFTGSFKPSGPLSSFDGRPANGSWQLRAQDSGPADTGSVRAFSLSVTPVICNAPPVGGTPSLSINDVSVTEGNSGTKNATFTVSLSATSTSAVTVSYATANGTATAGSDYAASSGSLTIAAGSTSQTFNVAVNGDTAVEPNETFLVNLSSPSGATIADAQGQGTIVNDDAAAAPSSAST